LIAAVLASAAPLQAQDTHHNAKPNSETASTRDGITREQAAKIIQELQMIRMILQQQQTSNAAAKPFENESSPNGLGSAKIAALGEHVLGSSSAPVTLVEFLDLQCPFCAQFHKAALPELKRKYIDTGKVRLAVMDLPLESHAYAVPAAAFAWCAGKQGKYWEAHNAIVDSNSVATPETLKDIASRINLGRAKLDQCSASSDTLHQVNQEAATARSIGVIGTPTFLLGRTTPSGAEGTLMQGAPPIEVLETKIDQILSGAEATAGGEPHR